MSFYGRLVHSAAVKRCAVTVGDTKERRLGTTTVVTGLSAVPCLMIQSAAAVERSFGRDVVADAIVQFPPAIDIRPGFTQGDGKSDQLVITDETGVVSTWWVLKTSPADAQKARGIVVAVKRWGGNG